MLSAVTVLDAQCSSGFWPTVRSGFGYDVSSHFFVVCLSVCDACIVAKPYVVGVGDGAFG